MVVPIFTVLAITIGALLPSSFARAPFGGAFGLSAAVTTASVAMGRGAWFEPGGGSDWLGPCIRHSLGGLAVLHLDPFGLDWGGALGGCSLHLGFGAGVTTGGVGLGLLG